MKSKNKEKVNKMKNVTKWTMKKKKFLKRQERKRSKMHDVKKGGKNK